MTRTLKGLIQSARLGMAPTLISNALAAWAVFTHVMPQGGQWAQIGQAVLLGFFFFLYGMWENDRVDARWDAVHRPNRPVPRGDVSVWTLRVASFCAGFAGLVYSALLTSSPWPGALLLVVITLYNWLHKKTAASLVLMGLCRGVWVLCAMLVYWSLSGGHSEIHEIHRLEISPAALGYALSLTLYTITASVVARGEAGHPRRKALAGFLLSGMSLHDMVWLICLGQYALAAVALACRVLSRILTVMRQRTT